MEYVDYLRKSFSIPVTINLMLNAVKAWYFCLITEGKRGDHHCRQLRLKDARAGDIQLHDLFTLIELEKLMERKERYPLATLRNRVVISLRIYQGLRQMEITWVRLQDINPRAQPGDAVLRIYP